MQSAAKDISPEQALTLLTGGDATLAKALRKSFGTLWKEMDANKRNPSTRRELLQNLAALSDGELDALARMIIALLAARKKYFSKAPSGEHPATGRNAGKEAKKKRVTIRVEYRKCGKDCRCNGGRGHGPYRYMYWWENRRLRSRYLGRA